MRWPWISPLAPGLISHSDPSSFSTCDLANLAGGWWLTKGFKKWVTALSEGYEKCVVFKEGVNHLSLPANHDAYNQIGRISEM